MSVVLFLKTLPKSTFVCLIVIAFLLFAIAFFINAYSELLQSNIMTLKFLKLTLEYVVIFDNSTNWQNALNIVNQTLTEITITK